MVLMIPNPQPLALLEVFPNPSGKEYALQWSNGTGKGEHGSLKMTDLLFNYCFYPTAFGLDGTYHERTYSACTYDRRRVIGGPVKRVSRGTYKVKLRPTYTSGAYDTGEQLYLMDGDDVWNFELSGKLSEFRIWLDKACSLGNVRRTLTIRTSHGTVSTHVPFLNPNP